MADANENVPTDTTSLKCIRRSSMRKAGRPPFDDLDTNVTAELTELRRVSKRVSFSDTHHVKIFEREQSGELSSSTDNATVPAASSGALPITAVDDNAAKSEEADQLPQFQCSAHEQSFYQGEEGEGDECSPCKKISPLEDALSCLMFGRGGAPNQTTLAHESMNLDGDSAASPSPTSPRLGLNRTTLAHESMELTKGAILVCDDATSPSPTSPRLCFNRTMFALDTMELTKAAMSMCDKNVCLAPSPSLLNLNRTRLAHESMDLTKAAMSMCDKSISFATSPSRLNLNQTRLAQETMDLTRAAISICDDTAEPTGTRFFPNLPMEITAAAFSPRAALALPSGSDATTYNPHTMNVTCVVAEVSPSEGKLPTGEDGAIPTFEAHRDECLSPHVAERAALPSILQMVSHKNPRLSWCDESPGRGGTDVEGRASPTPAPGIETHSEAGTCGVENEAGVIPMPESTLSCTSFEPVTVDVTKASSGSQQVTLATQVGALHAADGEKGAAVSEASSGGGLQSAQSEPVPSQAAVSVAGGSSLRCPPVDTALAVGGVGTLEVDSSKATPTVVEGVISELSNRDCGDVVLPNEASFGKTQHVSAMMDMTCASSRPVFAADETVADPTDRELASSTIVPLDDMEVTMGVTKTVQCQMSMTCANMTGLASNLLDTTNPSVGPDGMLGVGTLIPTCASEDLSRDVNKMSDTVDAAVGVEENAACTSIEDPRFRGADTLALYNTAVEHASNADLTGGLQIEATLTRVHHSFTVSSSKLARVVTSPTSDNSLGGVPQDIPLASEGKCPSFLEGTPKRGHADRVLSRSGTPANCTPSKRGISASNRAGTPASGVVVMSSQESVALQLLVSPANKSVTRARTPSRSSNTGRSPSFNCRSASLKKSFNKVHKAFNDMLDSAGNMPLGLDVSALLGTSVSSISSVPAGVDVSALLATSARSVCSSKILDSVFSPARQNAQGMNSLHSVGVGALERLAEASQQEKGSGSSQVPEEHDKGAKTVSDLDKTGAGTGVKDQECVDVVPVKDSAGTESTSGAVRSHSQDAAKTCSTVDKVTLATEAVSARDDEMQDATLANPSTCNSALVSEPQRKSATFVVNVGRNRNSATFVVDSKGRPSATFVLDGKARPSATFTVSSVESGLLCSRDSSSSVNTVAEGPLLAALGPKSALTSLHSRSEQRRNKPSGESDRGSGIQSTVTPRSRKRLQFTDVTGESAAEHKGGHGRVSANQSREGALTSATKPRQLSDHDGSSNSQRPLGSRSDAADEEMLMDIVEPTLVSSSYDKSTQQSLPACPRDGRDSTNSAGPMAPFSIEQREACVADQLENSSMCNEKALPETLPILASTFYSASSSARKKVKPLPSPPAQTKSAPKGASASKSRSAKSSRKRHLQATPATANKRSKGSKAVCNSHRKEPGPLKSTPKTSRQAAKSHGQEHADGAASESSNGSFSYGVRLQSLPTSPVEKTGGSEATLAQQVPNDLGSHTATELLAPMEFEEKQDRGRELFDNVDPELELTAGIDIEGILERLDDAGVQESLYWSVHQLPKALQEEWQLRICEALPHKAVFTFAGDVLELAVTLGETVEQPGTCTDQALKDAASGKVRRRTKRIAALRLCICRNAKCGPFSRFMCRRLMQQYKAGELLLQQYPTTDRLGEMLSELGGHFVRHRPLSHDIGRATRGRGRCYAYTFTDDCLLSIEVSHPRRVVWFHMDLPIDLDTYPHAEILPASRPYSGPVCDPGDQYVTIRTEKLRRITARVAPGPQYLTRIVDELDAFINKR